MARNRIKGNIPNMINENPVASSIIAKLTKDNTIQSPNPLTSNIPQLSLSTFEKIKNNNDIVSMFPDVELCIQILVSSIISPNDMTSSKLLYKAPDLRLPSELKSSIVKLIETHIDKNYDLNSKLATILREALFTKGAYIEAIIPEASLDDIIAQHNYKGNVSLEHFLNDKLQPTYKFLSSTDTNNKLSVSNEGIDYVNYNLNTNLIKTGSVKEELTITQEDLHISITDNPKVLNMHQALLKATKSMTETKLYGHSLSTENETLDKFFRDPGFYNQLDYIEVNVRDDASRESIGRPLIIKLPTESVIPVHVVNDPSKHLGYFVLVDNNGCPILGNPEEVNQPTDAVNNVNISANQNLGMISKAATALYGMTSSDIKLDNLQEVYNKLVENLIKKKLNNGAYGELVTIKENADVFNVMFTRALKNQQTKVLFLPSELVAYYAFDYRDNGTGKSLMEKASILYSIRSILLFSRLMSSIKNSTTVTEVQATLDEHDPDPERTKEQIISEVLKTRANMLPLGVTRPDDLVEWTHKLGLRFKFEHPGMPNLNISTSDINSSKVVPDDELERLIKESIIMSYGLTPEIVESGYASDFATTVVAKNLLTAKRVTRTQEQFNPLTTEHVRKICRNDIELINSIKDLINSNKQEINKFIKKLKKAKDEEGFNKIKQSEIVDYITNIFINEVETYLPEPQLYEANSSKNAFDDFKTMVEEASDMIFSTEAFPDEYVGELSGKIDTIKGIFKSVLFRKWMLDNNYLPEIGDFLTKDDDGKPIFNILENYGDFVNSLNESLLPFMKDLLKGKNKNNEKLQKIEEEANNEGSDDEDSSIEDEGNEDTTDEGGDETETETDDMNEEASEDEGSGDDDMDMDMDMSMGGDEENTSSDVEEDLGGDMDMDGESENVSEEEADEPQEDPESTELDNELKKAKLEKEKALVEKAKADAKIAKDKAGISDEENTEKENTEDEEQKDENNESMEGTQESDEQSYGKKEDSDSNDTQGGETESEEEKEKELEGSDGITNDDTTAFLKRNIFKI